MLVRVLDDESLVDLLENVNAKEVHENVIDEAFAASYLDQKLNGIFLDDDDLENWNANSKEMFE